MLTMLRFAQTCEAIAATTKKLEKAAILAEYLRSLPAGDAAIACIFFSGRPFASYKESTLQVGGALLWRTIGELSGKSEQALFESYRRHGDGGSVAAEVLPEKSQAVLTLVTVQEAFAAIAVARGPAAKGALLRELLSQATPLEAKYIVKIISGDLRIGLKESLVEEAIAKAFDCPLDQVKRANMLLGDVGETLLLASSGRLSQVFMRLFHPIDFMLASPVDSPEEALGYFENATVEDKYDGIRAHAHIQQGEVRLYSRTRDEITESFPELPPALASLPDETILDGEIVAWSCGAGAPAREESLRDQNAVDTDVLVRPAERGSADAYIEGRALAFSTLQQRLGRKSVSERLLRQVPVAYLAFDVLCSQGEILLDRPLRERRQILQWILPSPLAASGLPRMHAQSTLKFDSEDPVLAPVVFRAPVSPANSPDEIEMLFAGARARGNEGLMIKDLNSPYTPGRRGKSWLKMKRELATLDVVVTAVEYGHGKRIGVLSDYTFAVWDDNRLVNIGKAYSGLTDVEIAEMTQWFLAHVTRDEGLRLQVEPKIVLEVTFNNMMRSDRHESGYALRFPRIVRLRTDKLAEDADTIQTVKEIYEKHGG